MQRMGKKSEFFLCWVFVYLILIFRVSSLILCGRLCCWFPNALYEKALSQHSVHTVTQSPADLWYAPLGNYKDLFQSWNDSSTLSQGMCKGSFHLHMHEVNRVVKYSALSRKASLVVTMTDFWMLFYPELFLGGGLAFTCWLQCSKNWCVLRALMEAYERRGCENRQKLCNLTWSSAGKRCSLLCYLYYVAWPNMRDEFL